MSRPRGLCGTIAARAVRIVARRDMYIQSAPLVTRPVTRALGALSIRRVSPFAVSIGKRSVLRAPADWRHSYSAQGPLGFTWIRRR
ncbi:Hypothetical protein NTJ_04490 [Nesidiocoris tenuis]|uniref:Uncharacterized protein n=1 Tax=Nesidiocoris tenuis TaxID=355587 RepID=A0ABN7AK71_9HEMI|nr:Hypothetical protein NTJ_04490 [Nesidiocoris tenuis]